MEKKQALLVAKLKTKEWGKPLLTVETKELNNVDVLEKFNLRVITMKKPIE